MNRLLLVPLVGLLGWACTEPAEETSTGSSFSLEACQAAEETSRWVSSERPFRLASEYGRPADQELIDVWGFGATPSGDVLVFDAGSTRVLRLDGDLNLVTTFGREGRGPGEFGYQRANHGDWLAATESGFYVMDYAGLQQFHLEEGFVRYAARTIPSREFVMKIEAAGDQVVYGVDVINRNDGSRFVETWRIHPDSLPSLLRRDPMPSLPRWEGRLVRGVYVDQAEPLWSFRSPCVFLSDGSGEHVIAIDLATGRSDTIRIPVWEPPPRTPADERRLDRIRRDGARIGMNTGSSSTVPTAKMRWRQLLIDPDGTLWLEPWRPHSFTGTPLAALTVNPRTGRIDSVRVDRFPDAFLPDGSFVSLGHDTIASRDIVERHVRRWP